MEIRHSTENVYNFQLVLIPLCYKPSKGVPTYICIASRGQDRCGGVMFNQADPGAFEALDDDSRKHAELIHFNQMDC